MQPAPDEEVTLGPVRDMPVLQLDMRRIGESLVQLVAASVMLGHAEVRNTLSYWHAEDGTPAAFVGDVLKLGNDALTARWFKGREGAMALAGLLASAVIDPMLDSAPGPNFARNPDWTHYTAADVAVIAGITEGDLATLKAAGAGPYSWQPKPGLDVYPREHLLTWLTARAREEMAAELGARPA